MNGDGPLILFALEFLYYILCDALRMVLKSIFFHKKIFSELFVI